MNACLQGAEQFVLRMRLYSRNRIGTQPLTSAQCCDVQRDVLFKFDVTTSNLTADVCIYAPTIPRGQICASF